MSASVNAAGTVESTSSSPMPSPRRWMGTASHERIAAFAAAPAAVIPEFRRSSTRCPRSVVTICQLRPRPRASRWPMASSVNGPVAAWMTRSSPSTRAIEPPVNAMTPPSRSSVAWRIRSRSSSPAAAVAISRTSSAVARRRSMSSGDGRLRIVCGAFGHAARLRGARSIATSSWRTSPFYSIRARAGPAPRSGRRRTGRPSPSGARSRSGPSSGRSGGPGRPAPTRRWASRPGRRRAAGRRTARPAS